MEELHVDQERKKTKFMYFFYYTYFTIHILLYINKYFTILYFTIHKHTYYIYTYTSNILTIFTRIRVNIVSMFDKEFIFYSHLTCPQEV